MIDYYNINYQNYPMNDSIQKENIFNFIKKRGFFDLDICIIFFKHD